MKKIWQKSPKICLALVMILILALSFSCGFVVIETPNIPNQPFAPQATITESPGPNLATTPPAATRTAVPPVRATAPPQSASSIDPQWTSPTLSQANLPADLSDIVQDVIPSVAAINVRIEVTDIFNQSRVQEGAGSGWIIDPDGIIVTNTHVIEGAERIAVSLEDGRVFEVQQVAADPVSDIAVIKIGATGLPTAKLGDSSKLEVGMQVIAIGNALGEGISMTAGWVSQLGVTLTIPGETSTQSLFDLIKTSTPINPGNSGGPLVNMRGEVVGITNAKLVATGVENVGYAISTQTALPIINQLITQGSVTWPYMGVGLATVTPDVAAVYNLAVDSGAVITTIDVSGPASRAGLQMGDVIVKIGDAEINNAADAVEAIRTSDVGQTVTVTYYRGNTSSTAQVRLIQNPAS